MHGAPAGNVKLARTYRGASMNEGMLRAIGCGAMWTVICSLSIYLKFDSTAPAIVFAPICWALSSVLVYWLAGWIIIESIPPIVTAIAFVLIFVLFVYLVIQASEKFRLDGLDRRVDG